MVAISRTGGGQARAAALLFARGGATVVGYDRKSDGLVETRELAEREGLTLSTEHSQRRQSNGSMRRVGQSGCLNFLYNNAASVDCAPIEVNDAETVDGNAQR